MNPRLAIGLVVDPVKAEVRAALVRVQGAGLDCRVESLATATIADAASTSVGGTSSNAIVVGAGQANRARESSRDFRLADAVREVIAGAEVSPEQVLVVGLLCPSDSTAADSGATSASASYLAEATGITTIADFSERDRAAGGRGRPLDAVVDWIAAHDTRASRLVVHIDDTSSLSHLPARCGPGAVRVLETGPGVVLLDSLAAALTQGRQPSDRRGMLAVQGRQIKPLIRRWATHPFFHQDGSSFLQPSDFGEPFIRETLAMTLERGWSVADVLCSATHFVAACPADAVRQRQVRDQSPCEVTVVGSGAQNGLLLRLAEEQFNALGIASVHLKGFSPEVFDAVSAALLACLALDGVPANLPGVTGAAGPRLLGHFTPGTPRNWCQCLEWMHQAVRPAATRAA